METIYYFILGLIVFSAIFVTLYFINNPLDRSLSKIKYPYTLSLTPPLLSKNGFEEKLLMKTHAVQIFITPLDNATNLKNIRLLVIDPHGNPCESQITLNQNLTFPEDFAGCTLLMGNYSVILIEKMTNQTLITLPFDVVFSPILYSFGTFAFKDGLPITIGLIISALTTIYQFASTRNADRNRRSEEKAKWMLDNAKYYHKLYYPTAYTICASMENEGGQADYIHFDRNKVLYGIISFYEMHTEYLDKVNMYYFDDVLSETFLSMLTDRILYKRYQKFINDEIQQDLSYLTKFVGKKYYELKNDCYFNTISDKLYSWLSAKENGQEKTRAQLFYIEHLVFSWILDVCINEGLIVTYSSASQIEKHIRYRAEKKRDLLKKGIGYLNKEFYKDDVKHYYKFRINKKEIF